MGRKAALALALTGMVLAGCCPSCRLTDHHALMADKVQLGALVVDTRSSLEFEMGHIADAVNVPIGELSERIDKFPHDRAIVLYCLSGHRADAAIERLEAAGFTEVFDSGRYRCLKRALRQQEERR